MAWLPCMLVLVSIIVLSAKVCGYTCATASAGTSDISGYMSSLPDCARCYLDQQMDYDDIISIAHHMLRWEEKLCSGLGLTEVDIHDIPKIKSTPELQR